MLRWIVYTTFRIAKTTAQRREKWAFQLAWISTLMAFFSTLSGLEPDSTHVMVNSKISSKHPCRLPSSKNLSGNHHRVGLSYRYKDACPRRFMIVHEAERSLTQWYHLTPDRANLTLKEWRVQVTYTRSSGATNCKPVPPNLTSHDPSHVSDSSRWDVSAHGRELFGEVTRQIWRWHRDGRLKVQ